MLIETMGPRGDNDGQLMLTKLGGMVIHNKKNNIKND